jgi:hypothetical protein
MSKACLSIFCLLFCSFLKVGDELEPQLAPLVSEKYLKVLPSPFPPLSSLEAAQDWGREQTIGLGFARDLDLYCAKTTFKRASYLLPPIEKERFLELSYNILLCYYLGEKYSDVVYTVDEGSLRFVDSSFTPYHDLLLILYDSYNKQSDYRACKIFNAIEERYPETAQRLKCFKLLSEGDIAALTTLSTDSSDITNLLTNYKIRKKSTTVAQMLNMVFPGAGYWYIGQKQSAVTAFFLNTLFVCASAYAFHQGNIAAGVILAGFETGWYFGGIYGAGLGAKLYNERVYEKLAIPIMNQRGYFPVLMLKYGF